MFQVTAKKNKKLEIVESKKPTHLAASYLRQLCCFVSM